MQSDRWCVKILGRSNFRTKLETSLYMAYPNDNMESMLLCIGRYRKHPTERQ